MITERSRGTIELSLAMILSGTIGYFVVNSAQPIGNVIFFRCLVGSISLGLYGLANGIFRDLQISLGIAALIFLGGAALVINWYLLFQSFSYVPISVATAVYHIQPFFLVIAGVLLFKDRPKLSAYGWMGIAFLGLLLVVKVNPFALRLEPQALIGGGFAITAGALYTVATLIAKKTATIPPAFVAFVQVSMGIVIAIPLADFSALPKENRPWIDLLALGVVHTGLLYILLYASFRRLPTSMIAILLFIYPVITIVVDRIMFSISLGLPQMLGIGLILLAGVAVKLNWSLLPVSVTRSRPVHSEKT